MTGPEIAWLAGIYEGEGTCVRQVKNGRGVARLVIAMTDRDVIERVHRVAGVGVMAAVPTRVGNKPLWRWAAHGDDAVAVARLLWPWLGERRRDTIALSFGLRTSLRVEADDLAEVKRSVCPKCVGDKTRYERSAGGVVWICRPCDNAAHRVRRAG